MVGMFNVVLQKFLQDVDDMLPAKIIAYDRASNLAQVQPLISLVTTSNTVVNRAGVQSVPVSQFGGGGYMLNFPLNPGDLGWLKANDRDISIFKQVWGLCSPNTARKHKFSDATFIPVVLVNFLIAAADSSNVVLQAADGSTRLSMGAGNVCITDESGYSQSVNAVLDVASTTRAFIPPRMSTAQKNGIPEPIAGMLVYDTTEGGISVYNGSVWS